MNSLDRVSRAAFDRDGFVHVPGLLSTSEVEAVRLRAEAVVSGRGEGVRPAQVQTQYDREGRTEMVKVNQLTSSDDVFGALARRPDVVEIVETLIGKGARVFRDVLIVKPGGSKAAFSYHQDSAYWDIDPPRLVSCWLALTDVTEDGSCLKVIPRSHDRRRKHGLVLAGTALPSPVSSALRKLVSYAGTGDNPGTAGGYKSLWLAKRFILGKATRFLPLLAELQDFRALPAEIELQSERLLPVKAGDAIFFHSLLLHGSGPNLTEITRMAPIISYMPADARFVGKGTSQFQAGRAEATT